MKILCLYNNECALELFEWIKEQGHETVLYTEKLVDDWCIEQQFDLVVSYTYRYILSENTINSLRGNVVNLHNSYLPWNRGADPNIWSLVDETPRGVTLHYISVGLDKGDIISQKIVCDGLEETLKSSYNNLDLAAKELFKEAFSVYEHWQQMRKRPVGNGTYHSLKDGEKIKANIDTYDMLVSEFKNRVQKQVLS